MSTYIAINPKDPPYSAKFDWNASDTGTSFNSNVYAVSPAAMVTSADVGKQMIVKRAGNAAGTESVWGWIQAVTSPNHPELWTLPVGGAQVKAQITLSSTQFAWGSDDTTALNSAFADSVKNGGPRMVQLPAGWSRASQLVIPNNCTIRATSWGSGNGFGVFGGLLSGSTVRADGLPSTVGTLLQQLEGQTQDFVVFSAHPGVTWAGTWSSSTTYLANAGVLYEGNAYYALQGVGPRSTAPPSDPTNWAALLPFIGPLDVELGTLEGPYVPGPVTSPIGTQNGVNFSALQSDGATLINARPQDGMRFANTQVIGFPGDGFHFPNGVVPLQGFSNNRAYFNGGWGYSVSSIGGGEIQMCVLDQPSGDCNALGLVLINGLAADSGIVKIQGAKSEANSFSQMDMNVNSHEWAPANDPGQLNAIVLNNCVGHLEIEIDHVCAATDPATGALYAPGPAITIQGSVPTFSFSASVRVESGEEGTTSAINDTVNGVTVPPTVKQGFYGDHGADLQTSNATPQAVTTTPRTLIAPPAVGHVLIRAIGGGGQGGGGGSAVGGGVANQPGGAGGGAGAAVEKVLPCTPGGTITVTLGSGGLGGGAGGAANGGSGTSGAAGGATTVVLGVYTVTAAGGAGGGGSPGNTSTPSMPGVYGGAASQQQTVVSSLPGSGGAGLTTVGSLAGAAVGASGRGGAAGMSSDTTHGGNAGSPAGAAQTGRSTTSAAGGSAVAAPANTGQGGEGGGGGAPTGAGGNGGVGSSGFVLLQWLP